MQASPRPRRAPEGPGPLERRLVPDGRRRSLETLAHADAVHALAGHAEVTLAQDVLAPERERAHPELARHAVHLLLARPGHLRDAEPAEAPAGLAVGVDEVPVDARVGDPVGPERAVARVPHDDGADVGVRSLLPVDRRLPGHQRAVPRDPGPDGGPRGQPPRAGQELVLAVEDDADVTVGHLHGEERGGGIDGAQVHLRAVAAADHVGDHAHALLRELEEVGQHVAHRVRAHRAGPQRHHAGRVVERHGDVRLEMRVLHERRRERVLDHEVTARPCAFDVAAAELEVVGDVAVGQGIQHEARDLGALVRHLVRMDQRRPRGHRLHHVEDARQLVVVDGDPVDRLLGGVLVLRGHRGHDLARVAHAVDGQRRLVLLEEAVPARAVLPGDDGPHAGHRGRGRRVHVEDARVRDARAERLADEHAGEADVDTERRAAADLGRGVRSHHRRADDGRVRHAISSQGRA